MKVFANQVMAKTKAIRHIGAWGLWMYMIYSLAPHYYLHVIELFRNGYQSPWQILYMAPGLFSVMIPITAPFVALGMFLITISWHLDDKRMYTPGKGKDRKRCKVGAIEVFVDLCIKSLLICISYNLMFVYTITLMLPAFFFGIIHGVFIWDVEAALDKYLDASMKPMDVFVNWIGKFYPPIHELENI